MDKPINALQSGVLRWVADGCPEGAMQGHAHTSSAVALQSRRLVKISRRRGVWAAQITEAGRTYLQTGHSPPRRPPSTVKVPTFTPDQPAKHVRPKAPAARPPAEELVAWVVEGGGRLEISEQRGKDAIGLRSRVDSVNRFGKAPEGKRLVLTHIDWHKGVLSLEHDPRALRPARSFRVPERLSKAHPTARAYREDRDRHEVSGAHLSRAVRLVHALATEAECRGYELTFVALSEGQHRSESRSNIADGQFQMTIDGHRNRLRLLEKSGPGGGRVPYSPNMSLPLWQYRRLTMLVPTGRLKIIIDRGYGHGSGRSSTYADGVRVRLEDRLPGLLQELEVRALEAGWAQEALRRADEERELRRLRGVERSNIKRREARRGEVLDDQLKAWQHTNQLRRYLVAMAGHVEALEDGQERDGAETWLSWARDHLTKLDPLQGTLAMPADSP
jgi:hypothetical protein